MYVYITYICFTLEYYLITYVIRNFFLSDSHLNLNRSKIYECRIVIELYHGIDRINIVTDVLGLYYIIHPKSNYNCNKIVVEC